MSNQDNSYINFMNPFTSITKYSPYKEELLNQTPLPNSENRPNNQTSPLYYNLISHYMTPKKLDFSTEINDFKGNSPIQQNNDIIISPFNSKIEMSNYKIQNFRKNSLIELSPFKPMSINNLTPINTALFSDKK